ncbi:MAG: hypothetical protein AAFX96_11895 [Pseudomonadota bacterium]
MADQPEYLIEGLSRAELLDLTRNMPKGAIDQNETKKSNDKLGALDPLSVWLLAMGIGAFAAWLLKNRKSQRVEIKRKWPDGTVEDIALEITESTTTEEIANILSALPSSPG